MKKIFYLLIILCFSCNSQKTDNQVSVLKEQDTITYSEYKISKIFYTLPDGTAKEDNINIEFRYNNNSVEVYFPDSSWTFEITNIENKTEGTTIQIKDKKLKKYKEIFISAGELPIITFTTHTGTSNLSLM